MGSKHRRLILAVALGVAVLGAGAVAQARHPVRALTARPFASGFEAPVYVTAPRSQPGRLYVVEQPGRIRVLVNGKLRAQPFLDIHDQVVSGGEQGLLSVAFHPGYAKNHRFYVDYTDVNGDTRVVEYRSNGTVGLPKTARQLLFVKQPYANHNGGQLQFGPDGKLYVGMGDGGSGGDPQNHAQDLSSRLGKLLTIDVNAKKPRVTIAGYGLRNPWRFSFDRATGDLLIGDVGQGAWEELDRSTRAGGGGRGVNYGWRILEGLGCGIPPSGCTTKGMTLPLAVYSHALGCSVTGGYVYRGSAIPVLRGGYVFADYCSGEVWVVPASAGAPASKMRLLDTNLLISSFGENARGELLVTDLNGRVYRIDPA